MDRVFDARTSSVIAAKNINRPASASDELIYWAASGARNVLGYRWSPLLQGDSRRFGCYCSSVAWQGWFRRIGCCSEHDPAVSKFCRAGAGYNGDQVRCPIPRPGTRKGWPNCGLIFFGCFYYGACICGCNVFLGWVSCRGYAGGSTVDTNASDLGNYALAGFHQWCADRNAFGVRSLSDAGQGYCLVRAIHILVPSHWRLGLRAHRWCDWIMCRHVGIDNSGQFCSSRGTSQSWYHSFLSGMPAGMAGPLPIQSPSDVHGHHGHAGELDVQRHLG